MSHNPPISAGKRKLNQNQADTKHHLYHHKTIKIETTETRKLHVTVQHYIIQYVYPYRPLYFHLLYSFTHRPTVGIMDRVV